MAVQKNYNDGKLINGTSAADSIVNGGSNVSINAGAGDDTINGLRDDNNYIVIEEHDWTTLRVQDGDGNLIERVNPDNVAINAGNGNDLIENDGGQFISINASEGDDTVHNGGSDASINAGNGNNFVTNYGYNVSINTGNGNDLIENNADKTSR